ncbi:hypothetical protein PIROE2DRAFT_1771 [Piromyces sp. E2]|nr:hypothetical protein PIROE2DRAFT_1771 [Piromyces sp. E2]|eukprot:OUM70093.1 hypothetical protein PIROE2DRAFT_1771 [Piromyces sp. E2]
MVWNRNNAEEEEDDIIKKIKLYIEENEDNKIKETVLHKVIQSRKQLQVSCTGIDKIERENESNFTLNCNIDINIGKEKYSVYTVEFNDKKLLYTIEYFIVTEYIIKLMKQNWKENDMYYYGRNGYILYGINILG